MDGANILSVVWDIEPWSAELIKDGSSVAFVISTSGTVYNIFVLPDSGTNPIASKQYLFTA